MSNISAGNFHTTTQFLPDKLISKVPPILFKVRYDKASSFVSLQNASVCVMSGSVGVVSASRWAESGAIGVDSGANVCAHWFTAAAAAFPARTEAPMVKQSKHGRALADTRPNPVVFLDVLLGGYPGGRIVLEVSGQHHTK